MTTRMEIRANETGLVRVFRIDLQAAGIAQFDPAAALGAAHLERGEAQVFDVADLAGLGLSGYLAEGMGIREEDLEGMRARLDAIEGHVLVLPSRALGGRAQSLTPQAPLVHVGTFREERPAVTFEHLPDGAAQGHVPPPADPSGAPGRRGVPGSLILIGAALLAMALFLLGVLE